MQSHNTEESHPLLLVFDEGISHTEFIMGYLAYRNALSDQVKFGFLIFKNDQIYDFKIFTKLNGTCRRLNDSLWYLMNKMREEFNLKQKVPLTEEKLRKSLSFWLNLAQEKVKKSVIIDSKINVFWCNIEDQQEDDPKKLQLMKYWLPSAFPPMVNFVITTKRGSDADNHYKVVKCKRIEISSSEDRLEKLRDSYIKRGVFTKSNNSKLLEMLDQIIVSDERVDYSYAKLYLTILVVESEDSQAVRKLKAGIASSKQFEKECINSKKKLLNLAVVEISEILKNEKGQSGKDKDRYVGMLRGSKNMYDRIVDLLVFINMSLKGLKMEELSQLCDLSFSQIKPLLEFFRPLMTCFEDCYNLADEDLIDFAEMLYQPTNSKSYYKAIGDTLQDSQLNVRRLEEQMFAYYKASQDFTLKHIITSIDNFLLIFQPCMKKDVLKYWGFLIEKKYDPVIEYNKSLEAFEMHSQPSNNDLFLIITQLSRFFKELADYEKKGVPEFRHPIILNILLTVSKKSGIQMVTEKEKAQKKKHDSFANQISVAGGEEEEPEDNFFVKNEMKLNASDFTIKSEEDEKEALRTLAMEEQPITRGDQMKMINLLEDIGLLKEARKMKLYQENFQKSDILNSYENQNVDVYAGMMRYLEKFKEDLRLKELEKRIIAPVDNTEPCYIHEDSEDPKKIDTFHNFLESKSANNSMELKLPKIWEDGRLAIPSEKQPYYYYYKRWLWLIFPWACLCVDNTMSFSEMIQFCFSDSNKAIRVKDDQNITKQAQMIAVKTKYNKMVILEGKDVKGLSGSVSSHFGKGAKIPITGLTDRLNSEPNAFRIKSNVKKRQMMSGASTGLEFRTKRTGDSVTNYDQSSLLKQMISQTQTSNFYMTGLQNNQSLMPEEKTDFQNRSKTQNSFFSVNERLKPSRTAEFFLTDNKLNIMKQFPKMKYDKQMNDQLLSNVKKMKFSGMLRNLRQTFQDKAENEIALMQKKRNGLLSSLNAIYAKM